MVSVYMNATTTIAVKDATDSAQGVLNANSTYTPPQQVCDLPLILPNGTHGTISLTKPTWTQEHRDALGKRGWTLQEDLLSPRVIAYKDGNVLKRCRSKPTIEPVIPSSHKIYAAYDMMPPAKGNLISHLFTADQPGRVRPEIQSTLLSAWRYLVNDYSSRLLTFPEDRLSALAGLARAFGESTQDAYVAGMWKSRLIEQLCWCRHSDDNDSSASISQGTEKPEIRIIGPSWSWAQLYCRIYTHELDILYPELLDYHIDLHQESAPFGRVNSGWLKIRGKVVKLSELNMDGSEAWFDRRGDNEVHDIVCLLIGRPKWEHESRFALALAPSTSQNFRRIGLLIIKGELSTCEETEPVTTTIV